MKKLIKTEGTEFEQNYKDLALIETDDRAGIPTMISSEDFNEGYSNADSETKNLIHAGGGSINNQDKRVTSNGEYRADDGYTGLGTVTVEVPQEGGAGVQGVYELIMAPESHLDNGAIYTIDDLDFTAVYDIPEISLTIAREPIVHSSYLSVTASMQSIAPSGKNVRIDSFTAAYTSGGEPVEVTAAPQYPMYVYPSAIVTDLPDFDITDKYPDDVSAITVTANLHYTNADDAQIGYICSDIVSRLGNKYIVVEPLPGNKTITLTQKMGYYSDVAPTLVSALGEDFYVNTVTAGETITAVRVEGLKSVNVTNNYMTYSFSPDYGYDVIAGVSVTTQIDLPLTTGIKFGFSDFSYLPQDLAMNSGWYQVLDCENMFYYCENLQSINNLNTIACTDFKNMFYGCTNLQSVGNISMSSCQKFLGMFANCVNLNNNSLDNILTSINSINVAGLIDDPKIAEFGFSDSQMTYIKNSPMLSTLTAKGWSLGNSVTLNVDLTEFRSKIDSGNNFDLPWSQDLADLMNTYTTEHIILEDTTLEESIEFVATYMGGKLFRNDNGTISFELGEEWNSQDEHYDYYCTNIVSNELTVEIINKVFDGTNTTFDFNIFNNNNVAMYFNSIAFNGETPIVYDNVIFSGDSTSGNSAVVGDYSASDITYVIDNDRP